MAHDKLVNIFDISKSMLKYPWLEYQNRTKELRKAMAPVHLPLSCYKVPKEEFPLSPECWRKHPSRPNAVPYCYTEKPEVYTHWCTLCDRRREREERKMLRRNRHLKKAAHPQNFYLPISKLTIQYQVGSKHLLPDKDPQKWQRLKELTESLQSPREDEQCYAIQALVYLGINDKLVMEALRQVAQTGPEKVRYEASRALAVLGCLNKYVIQALIQQLKGENEGQKMDTLLGLRVALNSWAAVPKAKRVPIGEEERLVPVLQKLIKEEPPEAALEAALCLGFLRPSSKSAQRFLVQCLSQGPKTQQMKALRMLVRIMNVHSAAIIRAILDQLCSSSIPEDRFEATQMLSAIGLEQIQAQGLEDLTFELLRRKTHNEPFLALRQAVAETVRTLKMMPLMINLVEAQLMDPNTSVRQEAVISLGVLGIRSPQVFHLLLDMLDTEENKAMKKSLQETLLLGASTDPWIQNMLKNKVFFVYETPKTVWETEPTRFRREPEIPEELNIQDFRLVELNPLFIAKTSTKVDQREKFYNFLSSFSKPQKQKPPTPGPWEPGIRKKLRTLAESS